MQTVLLVQTAKMTPAEIDMKYYDYEWDLHPDKIIIDEAIDIDKLGWKGGDYFKLVNIDGKAQLIRLDPLLKFLKDGEENGSSRPN